MVRPVYQPAFLPTLLLLLSLSTRNLLLQIRTGLPVWVQRAAFHGTFNLPYGEMSTMGALSILLKMGSMQSHTVPCQQVALSISIQGNWCLLLSHTEKVWMDSPSWHPEIACQQIGCCDGFINAILTMFHLEMYWEEKEGSTFEVARPQTGEPPGLPIYHHFDILFLLRLLEVMPWKSASVCKTAVPHSG